MSHVALFLLHKSIYVLCLLPDTCLNCDTVNTTYEPVANMTVSVDVGSMQEAVTRYMENEEIIEDFVCGAKGGKCLSEVCIKRVSFYTYPKVLRIIFNR